MQLKSSLYGELKKHSPQAQDLFLLNQIYLQAVWMIQILFRTRN